MPVSRTSVQPWSPVTASIHRLSQPLVLPPQPEQPLTSLSPQSVAPWFTINLQWPVPKPADVNLKQVLPPLGVASTFLWGLSGLLEHGLHSGHTSKGSLLNGMGKLAPLFNVLYGGVNLLGAMSQGYAVRSVAFGTFTAFSALMALPMLWYNHKPSLALQPWVALYQAVAPIGMLTGLFSITKVSQSTPGVRLEHTTGKTWRELLQGKSQNGFQEGLSLWQVLAKNWVQELSSFGQTLQKTRDYGQELFENIKDSARRFLVPPQNWQLNTVRAYFANGVAPLTDRHSVPLAYSWASVLRSASAVFSVGMMLLPALRPGLIKVPHVGLPAVPVGQAAKTASKLGSVLLLGGQLAGTFAGLFTRFYDWPSGLSVVYRTSGLAYGASAVAATLNLLGKQRPLVLGLDERMWTKMGAFIQGSAYFANLWLKNHQTGKEI